MSAWLFYALAAPFLFSIVNVFDKFLREKHLGTFTLSVFVGLASFWALALLPFVNIHLSAPILVAGLVTGALFFANAFPYFQALAIEEASRVIPLWAFEAPMVLVLAFVFLNERLLFSDYVGFILVVAGAFLVLTRKLGDVLKPNKAFFLMLLASSMTAVGIVISKWLYSQMSFWATQALIGLGVGLAALLTLFVLSGQRKKFFREMLRLRRTVFLQLFFRESAMAVSGIVFGLAVMTGSAALSTALVEIDSLFVFIIAAFLSKFLPHILEEAIDKKTLLTKTVAIAMIIAGVFLISL